MQIMRSEDSCGLIVESYLFFHEAKTFFSVFENQEKMYNSDVYSNIISWREMGSS